MTIQEKINFAAQPYKLFLFKEGMFYKLYNQNAMWFVDQIKAYKVNNKFVKTVNQNVYSIGFPVSSLQQIEQQLKNIKAVIQQTTAHYITYTIPHIIEKNNYMAWCKQHTISNTYTNTTVSLKQQIQGFDLANKTPMQALEFISKLQKEL